MIAFRSLPLFLAVALASAASQAQAPAQTPNHFLAGCGSDDTQFSTQHGAAGDPNPPDSPGSATVYVTEVYNIHDKGRFLRPTLRIGADGVWQGATQGFSFIRFNLTPGTHHLCTRWQSGFKFYADQVSLFNLDAEAGKTYYFRIQILTQGGGDNVGPGTIDLQPVSTDEGRFLVSQAAISISQAK
jgi:hypothetical protein